MLYYKLPEGCCILSCTLDSFFKICLEPACAWVGEKVMVAEIDGPGICKVLRGNQTDVARIARSKHGLAAAHSLQGNPRGANYQIRAAVGIDGIQKRTCGQDKVLLIAAVDHAGQGMDKAAVRSAAHNGQAHTALFGQKFHCLDGIFDDAGFSPGDAAHQGDEVLIAGKAKLFLNPSLSAGEKWSTSMPLGLTVIFCLP